MNDSINRNLSAPLPSKTAHRELSRLAERHPELTLLQVIERLDRDVWQVEELPAELKAIYSNVNARRALSIVHGELDRHRASFALDAPPRARQWLATGRFLQLPRALPPAVVERLGRVCSRLFSAVGTPPLRVFEHPELVEPATLRALARQVLEALPEPLPPDATPALLKKRTLLRRTFPPARSGELVGNANNQHWHQDSNFQFNDEPMLTLWVPLQDLTGVVRPSIQIWDAPVSYFSVEHGDSSPDVLGLLAPIFPSARASSIAASAGDCVVFNGLTFHQTSSTAVMTEPRDALLIRLIERRSAARFLITEPERELLSLD